MYKIYDEPKNYEEYESSMMNYFSNRWEHPEPFLEWLKSDEGQEVLHSTYRNSFRDGKCNWESKTQCIELMY